MKVGDTVRLADTRYRPVVRDGSGREDNSTAKIKIMLKDIPGGVVLDRELHGLMYWNVSDLEKVEKTLDVS